MNVIRCWIVVAGVAVCFWGTGCASKSQKTQKSETAAPSASSAPAFPKPVATNAPGPAVTTPAVYVPDMTHVGQPLPDGVLAWDALTKSAEATNGQSQAHFVFSFTNISSGVVAIVNVHPSCGCTTAQLPPLPWVLSVGTNGQIPITVNLAGKSGMIFKTVNVATDKGSKTLTLRINILPPPVPTMTDAERIRAMEIAKVDRQAVFKNDCAQCHAAPANGKYGKALFNAVCAVCHEAQHRASMVPDLHALKVPTNEDFWRTWITHGKPGTFMPAFSAAEGGPLNDMQIASLAVYLNAAIPSNVPQAPQ
jgi:mono/diheme cytochrome c family protein